MAEPGASPRGLPRGVIALVVFLVTLGLVLLLWPEEEDPQAVPPAADTAATIEHDEGLIDGDVGDVEQRVRRNLERTAPRVRPVADLAFRLERVRWREPVGQGDWLDVERITGAIEGRALAAGGFTLTSVRIHQPQVRLREGPGGVWNFERVLEPLLDGDGRSGDNGIGAGAPLVALRDVRVLGGHVVVDRLDGTLQLRDLNATIAQGRLSGPRLDDPWLELARADATLVPPGDVRPYPVAVDDARVIFPEGRVLFRAQMVAIGASDFSQVVGVWDPDIGGIGLELSLRGDRIRLAELPFLQQELPEDAVAGFQLTLRPLDAERSLIELRDLALRTPSSAATGRLDLVLGGPGGPTIRSVDLRLDPLAVSLLEAFTGPLPYAGELRGSVRGPAGDLRLDLVASLRAPTAPTAFTTRLRGRIALDTPTGLDIRDLTADLEDVPLAALQPVLPGLPFGGVVDGQIRLTGAPGETPIRLDVALETGGGTITAEGALDLRGAAPSYDLRGRMAGVDLESLLPGSAPPAEIFASYTLSGTGTDPESARARLAMNGTFTGWRTDRTDTLVVAAALADGRLDVDALRVELGPLSARADGEWNLDRGAGRIEYALEVASLEPFGPYLPGLPAGHARGSLALEGRIEGTLAAPRLSGSISAEELRYDEWAAGALEGEYTIDMAGEVPRVEARFGGARLATPSGDYERGSLVVTVDRPTFALRLAADQAGGGVLELAADGTILAEGGRELFLRRFEVDLREQRWRLREAARVAWSPRGDLVVDDFVLAQTDGEGLVRLDGRLLPVDAADVVLETAAMPVGEVLALAGLADQPVTGRLWANARLRGPGDAPLLDAELRLVEGALRGVRFAMIEGTIGFQDRRLDMNVEGAFADSGQFRLEGTLPATLALGVPPSLELVDEAPVRVTFRTDEVPLRVLEPGSPLVSELDGRLRADVRLAGTPAAPRLEGFFQVAGGAATLTTLNQRYEDITADLRLDGRELTIRELRARSDGTVEASGALLFEELTNPSADLTFRFQEFRVQGVEDQRDAALWGDLRVTGSLQAPRLAGDVRVDDGTVLVTPFIGEPDFSEELSVLPLPTDPQRIDGELVVDERLPWSERVRISNLRVAVGDDLWFETEETRAQLQGVLQVEKPGAQYLVSGTLEGERGTFTVRVGPVVRRFDIIRAEVRFFGSPDPDPGLDILASRTQLTGDTQLEVQARIQGTLAAPRLTLMTPDGVQVPESELLSILVFGQPSFALGGGGFLATGLAAPALALGVSDYLSIFAEEALINEAGLPLDYVQIRVGSISGEGQAAAIVVGKEVLEDVWLTFDAPLAEENAWAVRLEWRIDRQWSLRAGFEPVDRWRLLTGAAQNPFSEVNQQLFLQIRRRWTY